MQKISTVNTEAVKKLKSSLMMKANEMYYFSNLFDKLLYMFQTCPLYIIRSISTLYKCNRYLSF